MDTPFKALILENEDGKTSAHLGELTEGDLPDGDVTVDVDYSTLNYKDALAITGAGKIVRSFPFVPGIDFAGRVRSSQDDRFKPGDPVLLTGYGVGEKYWGGLTQRVRTRADWLVPLPEGLSLQQSMAIGTAGFTAMLCVMSLEEAGISPDQGEIVVTGAAGGVGSVALALLQKAGFSPVASSGRPQLEPYLKELGADRVVGREELLETGKAPLGPATWAGAVDTAGGDTLAGLLKTIKPSGAIAACGLAGGPQLNTTVFPFILRGVRLLGVDSVMCPMGKRVAAWQRLARDLPTEHLDRITSTISLEQALSRAPEFLKGAVQGRLVVQIDPST